MIDEARQLSMLATTCAACFLAAACSDAEMDETAGARADAQSAAPASVEDAAAGAQDSAGDAQQPASPASGSGDCEASGPLRYVCGPVNAEDIVRLGDSDWLVVSGMSTDDTPGRLYLVDHEAKTHETWFPGENPAFEHDADMFGVCPGPLDTSDFSAHGLALEAQGPERYRLYITSHGAREAIEVFDVDTSSALPGITWIGCVPLPERTMSNSVAILDDGGFVTTKMMDPTNPDGFADIMAGEISGLVYEWHPGGDVEEVPGTELSGANGIELSPDQRYMYVAAIGSREVARYDLEASPPARDAVTIGVRPDNLRWTDDGTLYTIGGDFVPPEECADPPCETGWSVIEIDPDTLEATRVTGVDEDATLQGASTALAVGDEIWIGTFQGDRVGYLPRP